MDLWAVRKTVSIYNQRCYFPSYVKVTVISTNIPNSKANTAFERKSLNRQVLALPTVQAPVNKWNKNFSVKTFSLAPPFQTSSSSGVGSSYCSEMVVLFILDSVPRSLLFLGRSPRLLFVHLLFKLFQEFCLRRFSDTFCPCPQWRAHLRIVVTLREGAHNGAFPFWAV